MPRFVCSHTGHIFGNQQAYIVHTVQILLGLELDTLYEERTTTAHAIRAYLFEVQPDDLHSFDLDQDDDHCDLSVRIICYHHALATGDIFHHPGACNPFNELAIKYSDRLGITLPEPID